MSDEHTEEQEPAVVAGGVGARLREAREEAGLELNEVAAKTRIPQRHLLTIENGALTDLPARTYAVGFSRTYARLVGLDEREIVEQARMELAAEEDEGHTPAKFEPGDPARVRARACMVCAVRCNPADRWHLRLLQRLFRARHGAGTARRSGRPHGRGGSDDTDEPGGSYPHHGQRTGGHQRNGWHLGQVLARMVNGSGQMDEGDSFTVPADAEGPQVWTGRPSALAITVGGRSVPKLSEVDEVIKDVPITAEALLARADAAPRAPATPAPGEG